MRSYNASRGSRARTEKQWRTVLHCLQTGGGNRGKVTSTLPEDKAHGSHMDPSSEQLLPEPQASHRIWGWCFLEGNTSSHLMHQKPQKDQGATRGINSTRVCHGFQEILSTPMLLIVVRRPLLVHGVTLVASGFSGRSRASREIRAMIWLAVGLGCCLLRLAH